MGALESRIAGGSDAVDARPEMAQLAERRGVERGGRHAAMAERGQPAGHLRRRLVRERDDQHVARPDDARRQRVGDAPRDHPGLAAARAGQDAQRPGRDRRRPRAGRDRGRPGARRGRASAPGHRSRAGCTGGHRAAERRLPSVPWISTAGSSPSARSSPPTPRSSRRSWPSRRSLAGGAPSTSSASGATSPPVTRTRRASRSSTTAPCVGYIQAVEEREPDFRHAGIDLFLRTSAQGRGLGPDAIRTLAAHLIDDRGHHRITIDPAAANEHAISAYTKSRFPAQSASCGSTSGSPMAPGSTPS